MTNSNTLTSKGQVTIPANIRRSLGLKAGEAVVFKFNHDKQVVIEKNDWKQALEKLHKEVSAHLKKHNIKPLSDKDLDDAINLSAEQAAAERYERTLQRQE